MPKSNAQRQADYRQRHLKDENSGLERVNALVTVHAKRQLERLADCYGVTQRACLERILADAERACLDALPTEAHGAYFDKRLPGALRGNAVTDPVS
jgi:hypothetical protein